jgi:aminoglycoside 3-N-acetyltransferase
MTKTTAGRTQAELVSDLVALGVRAGDVLFIHSSFRSLGPIVGGAGAVVAALEQAVGPGGAILMPSFNLVDDRDRARVWNVQTAPSTVGWLTEYFRLMPGTLRSDHYSHAVCARGHDAAWYLAGHGSQRGPVSPWDRLPWGRAFGDDSPMARACDRDGQLLMLGVDYTSSTYIHVVEARYREQRRRTDPHAAYGWINRPLMGRWWDEQGRLHRGRIGEADCRLFSIRDYVDTVLAEVQRDPHRYVHSWTM